MPAWLSSSPLSTPANSPLKPIVLRGESESEGPDADGMDEYRRKKRRLEEVVEELEDDDEQEQGRDEDADADEDEAASDEYEVEAIIGRRGGKNGANLEFKIRWKDCGPNDDSWEPASNIQAPELIKQYERRRAVKDEAKRAEHLKRSSSSQTPSSSTSIPPVRKSVRDASTASGASMDIKPMKNGTMTQPPATQRLKQVKRESGSVEARPRKEAVNPAAFFYRDPLCPAYNLILPTATAVAEDAFARIRSAVESSVTELFPEKRRLIAIHPATLVSLRSPEAQSTGALKKLFRHALKESVEEVKERRYAVLSTASVPATSIFKEKAIDDMLRGGESYRLAWPWGLEEGHEAEFYHILVAVQHIQETHPEYRCRVLVRRSKPGLREAADYFKVELVDLHDMLEEIQRTA